MADATYQPKVYRKQGSTEFVIADGGKLTLESGATLSLTGQAITTTGALTANSVTSTGTGTFNAVTSTGTGTFNAVTSTGTGTFNAVTSTGTGTFNAVTSTGTGTFNAVSSTGQVSGSSVTSTGAISGLLTATYGFKQAIEVATSSWSSIAAYGYSVIKSTGTAEQVYALGAPVAGMEKIIICNTVATATGSSTGAAIITTSGAGAAISTNGYTSILFSTALSSDPPHIRLVGTNSTNWQLVGFSTYGAITFSTT